MLDRLAKIAWSGLKRANPELPLIEQLQFMIDQCLPGTIGLRLVTMDELESTAVVEYRVTTAGLHGLMHGGTIFATGDTITALMLMLHADDGVTNVLTRSASIRYLRPVPPGGVVTAKSRITKRDGDNYDLVCAFYNEDDERVAQGRYKYTLPRS